MDILGDKDLDDKWYIFQKSQKAVILRFEASTTKRAHSEIEERAGHCPALYSKFPKNPTGFFCNK